MKVPQIGKRSLRAGLTLLPVALALSACGGGGADDSGPIPPILQIGMQRQYIGTTTRTVTYANPATPGYTLGYSFTENQTVQQAPPNVNASFDVQSDYSYAVTQDPGVGTTPISQTIDSYQNLQDSGGSQMTATVGVNSVVVSNDETSDGLGGGPYVRTTTTSTTYPTTRYSFSYPLQSGASMNVPQSASQTIDVTDVNAAGVSPPNGSNVSYTQTRTANDDGSYSYQTAYVDGDSKNLTQNSDGSGNYTSTSATGNTTTTLGLPTMTNGALILPVTRSSGANSTNYAANDWYPSNGQPNSPLELVAETVIGPTSTMPAQCDGALLRPDIYEIDTTSTSQSTIEPSYSVTQTQSFNADGVLICSVSQSTSYNYDLLTGALNSTTTTQTQSILNWINY